MFYNKSNDRYEGVEPLHYYDPFSPKMLISSLLPLNNKQWEAIARSFRESFMKGEEPLVPQWILLNLFDCREEVVI